VTDIPEGDNTQKAAVEDLKSYAQRIERIRDEVALLKEDEKEVFQEAKNRGYDVAALRAVISLSKKKPEVVAAIHVYGERMGIFA
jgi:uncharacterized protein (UPF0335 family)